MSESWSPQSGDDPDDFDTWRVRRNAHLALSAEADALARDLWNQSTQNGDRLYAGNPSDLTAIGLAALSGTGSYTTTTAAANDDDQAGESAFRPMSPTTAADDGAGSYLSRTSTRPGSAVYRDQIPADVQTLPADPSAPWVSEIEVVGRPADQAPHTDFLDSLDHNPLLRGAAGVAGYAAGLPWGALRAGWHALEGVGHGLDFADGLLVSPDARAKAWNDAQTATHDALQYGRSVLANPSRLAGDALSGAKAANRALNPLATPIPDTASGAFGHELSIGANDGETLTNVAGIFAAPEVFGGIRAAQTFAATREAKIAEMMERGLDEPTARHLSKRYDGQGDHALIQKSQKSVFGYKTPWLKEAPIPKWFMDGPLNVSKPRGLSQYDFYRYHYGVDPQFYGGSLPGKKGFSGAGLGFERYSNPGRSWARIPPIYKDYSTGVTSGDALRLLHRDPSEAPQ